MWMTDYINAVKRGFRDQHGFKPKDGSSEDEPLFDNIPDGEYPMTIEGKLDKVRIASGKISCCNFEEDEGAAPQGKITDPGYIGADRHAEIW